MGHNQSKFIENIIKVYIIVVFLNILNTDLINTFYKIYQISIMYDIYWCRYYFDPHNIFVKIKWRSKKYMTSVSERLFNNSKQSMVSPISSVKAAITELAIFSYVLQKNPQVIMMYI